MDIKEFIKSTITQISEAVSELNEEMNNGTIVNPSCVDYSHKPIITSSGASVTDINFDLGVTVTETADTEGKIGIFSSIIGVGASAKEGSQNATVSRVQFSIPLMLPYKNPYN